MNNHQYKTSSLPLASAISLVSTSKLQFIEKSPDSNKAIFVFNITPDLETIIQRFWDRSLPVDAFSYFEATKFLKTRLYEAKEGIHS